jgi:Ca2+-binding EF-hand superfamily protein
MFNSGVSSNYFNSPYSNPYYGVRQGADNWLSGSLSQGYGLQQNPFADLGGFNFAQDLFGGNGFGPGFGQQPRIDNLFSQADTDANGGLSQTEFNAMQPPSFGGNRPQPTDAQKTAMFNRIDSDGDGSVSLTEMQDAAPPPPPRHFGNNGFGGFQGQPPNPEALFSQADTDANGGLSQTEFNAMQPPSFGGNRPQPTDAQKTAMFNRIDSDGDGSVSLTEMQDAAPPPPPRHFGNNGFGNGWSPQQGLSGNLSQILIPLIQSLLSGQ